MFQAMTDWAANVLLPLGGWGLFLVAFAESSFFPIPPDVLLFPLVLAAPRLALVYAAVCTSASVLGALFGYLLGARAGRAILRRLTSEATIAKTEALFQRWGGWAVGIAAFTPIPYKVFTIAGGLFRVEPAAFVFASVVGRGGRFFSEAVLLQLYGRPMLAFLGKNFEWLTIALAAAVVGGYALFRLLGTKRPRPAGEGEEAWHRHAVRAWRGFVDRRLEVWGEHAVYFLAGWVAFALALLGLGKIVNEVFLETEPLWEDLWLMRLVHGWSNPALTRFMVWVTRLGSAGAVLALAATATAALAVRRRYVEAVTTAAVAGG
ncbi:MAG TPA: DedA family protein, partial [Firmicutes bacterium]|nr:DedA family protein [Bacillota bacterium]